MCHAGAKGKTAHELKQLLEVGHLSDEQILSLNRSNLAILNQSLNNGDVAGLKISSVNRIFINKDQQCFTVNDQFAETLSKHFQSETEQIDFSNEHQALGRINEWIRKQTNEKITQIADSLDAQTQLLLVNAIYFKGFWRHKFKKEFTKQSFFHLTNGKKCKCQMMQLGGEKFKTGYHSDLQVTLLELPYEGGSVAMMLMLPDLEIPLAHVEANLSPAHLDSILQKYMPESEVNVKMPKFKLKYKQELCDHFKQLGASLPFNRHKADFSGLTTANSAAGFAISRVLHQAFIEVDEEGTEAAAFTADEGGYRCLRIPQQIILDRSFMFFIYEKVNRNILFIGKCCKPLDD
jgi:serpin B